MNKIIDTLLREEVKSEQIILWLNTKESEVVSNSKLSGLLNVKHDFIPLFLNFLREQTCRLVHSNSHTGLTPNKSVKLHATKYISPSKLSRKPSLNKSSKAKTLDFSKTPTASYVAVENTSPDQFHGKDLDSFLESDDTPNLDLPLRTPIKGHSKFNSPDDSPFYSSSRYSTSTPKHFSFSPISASSDYKRYSKRNSFEVINHPEETKASDRKFMLSDYFVPDKSSKKKKSSTSKINISNELSSKVQLSKETDSHLFDLENTKDFPPVGFDASDTKIKTRRIKPTLVAVSCHGNKKVTDSKESFGIPSTNQVQANAFLVAEEDLPKSLELERKLLKEQKDKIKSNSMSNTMENYKSDNKKHCSNSFNSKFKLKTELQLVTHKLEIDKISQIYSSLINFNMVPNIMVEIYFLLQILVVDVNEVSESLHEDNSEIMSYFSSINNCIYFSIKSLSLIFNILKMFDRSFIRVLSENPRILNFNHLFYKDVITFYQNSSVPVLVRRLPQSPILSVSFQTETDNKNNFPSCSAFQTFRKQRDLLYEMIRIWEDKHLTPDWSYSQNLGSRTHQLLSLRSDAVNYSHFARLFLSQLITMCKGNEQCSHSAETEDLQFLNQLKRQNPEKYKRLFERLITPSKVGGPVPLPSFLGPQEFFKDFITFAGNHSFNIHLRDALIVKILQLNAMNLDVSDLEESEYIVLREEAWSTLKSLRLLAKFLGYIEFLPYKTCESLSDNVLVNQVQIRNHLNPPISFMKILQESASNGSLLMVVPWLVELLSMVDAVAFHTQYYLTLMFTLIFIYRLHYIGRFDLGTISCNICRANSGTKFTMDPMNGLFLKLILGWLFSLPNIPENLFYALVEEAEIDQDEFHKTTQIINDSYACLCAECFQFSFDITVKESHPIGVTKVSNQIVTTKESHPIEGIESDDLVKRVPYFSPAKGIQILHKTPMKNNAKSIISCTEMEKVDLSPLKTPSKYLEVSMLDTPQNTPNKVDLKDTGTLGKRSFDSFTFIDHQVLLTCCPYLNELKSIINDFSLGSIRMNCGSSFRKITPLSTSEKSGEQPYKVLQLQLEDNFFHNQPSSTKKTVDFVVERIYSNVLRNVRSTIIPMLKDDCLNRLKACVSSSLVNLSTMDKLTEATEKKIHALSQDLSIEIKEKAMKNMEDLLESKSVETSLRYLLPTEVSEKSVTMCLLVIFRVVREKVTIWLNSQLSSGFCSKELTLEAKKFIKLSQKTQHNDTSVSLNDSSMNSSFTVNSAFSNYISSDDHSLDLLASGSIGFIFKDPGKESQHQLMSDVAICHNLDAMPPSMKLQQIKNSLKMLTTEVGIVDSSLNAMNFLKDVHRTITERKDMTLAVFKAVETLSIDWMAAICMAQPKLITKESIKFFARLWSPTEKERIFKEDPNFTVFLVPRTIMLLGQQRVEVQSAAWTNLEEILVEIIIVNNFMKINTFQDLCIALLRHAWPDEILHGLSTLIKKLVDKIQKSAKGNDPDICQLVDWVGWVCSEMEEY